MARKNSKQTPKFSASAKVSNKVVWLFTDSTSEATDIETGACPFCYAFAVTKLPAKLLAVQPDGTTHVCHPALGGCNHGFAKEN